MHVLVFKPLFLLHPFAYVCLCASTYVSVCVCPRLCNCVIVHAHGYFGCFDAFVPPTRENKGIRPEAGSDSSTYVSTQKITGLYGITENVSKIYTFIHFSCKTILIII